MPNEREIPTYLMVIRCDKILLLLLSNFHVELKKELEIQVSTAVNKIEESLFGRYNQTNKEVEEKIQEFMAVITRIGTQ